MVKTMNKKYVTYGLIGIFTSGFAIALSIYTGAQQASITDVDGTEMMHHPSSEREMADSSANNPHSQHAEETVQIKLAISEAVVPGQSTLLTLEVKDKNGQPITDFETFQEKLMHLIVVSDDFQSFEHLHPDYLDNGRFTVQATFPESGSYTLFSDYKPTNQNEAVSVLKVTVPGATSATPAISFDCRKTVGTTQATLDLPSTIRAGQEVMIRFDLKDVRTNQSVQDLQPYLGEQGHLVILRQSSSLSRADYIHAHALRNTPSGQISFMTTFPEAGQYKLWGQFDRNGEIVVADFWVNVQ